MPQLIYPEESDDKDSLSNPPYVDTTLESIPPSEKFIKEPALEPDSYSLS